jgi:acetamidase/formamidase
MMIQPQGGVLPEEFAYLRKRLVRLDAKSNTAKFAPTNRIPIRPFFGKFGVAPPMGRLSSRPPA